jgi:hypothetical protein
MSSNEKGEPDEYAMVLLIMYQSSLTLCVAMPTVPSPVVLGAYRETGLMARVVQ